MGRLYAAVLHTPENAALRGTVGGDLLVALGQWVSVHVLVWVCVPVGESVCWGLMLVNWALEGGPVVGSHLPPRPRRHT